MRLGPRYKYEELTREEVLSLKDGDICYIDSSYGINQVTYPKFNETHRNMMWSDQLTKLGYEYKSPKTIEMLRDWGPIYKRITLPENWEE